MQKTILQHVVLPFVYFIFKHKMVEENLVIFADSKNDDIPYSLNAMHKKVLTRGYKVLNCCCDYSKLNIFQKLIKSILFMRYYAAAKYIFICDYFLPVSSCNKKEETKVIQLWHSSGLQKKFGYDAADDLGYCSIIDPVKNFDLVSVSSGTVKEVFKKAWRLDDQVVKAFGTSRTDILFDKEYAEKCKREFYELYPELKNKNIVLWAPTFRGNAVNRELIGIEEILKLQKELSDKYFFIIKTHPHIKEEYMIDNCSISTEKLYFVADILITDYSSIMYDFLALEKEIIFFIPDIKNYRKERGLYIEYNKEFEYKITQTFDELANALKFFEPIPKSKMQKYKKKYLMMCDGCVSDRILNYLENRGV